MDVDISAMKKYPEHLTSGTLSWPPPLSEVWTTCPREIPPWSCSTVQQSQDRSIVAGTRKILKYFPCYVYKSSQPTFRFVSLLLGSSLTSFCFFGLLVWTTTFSSGLMITESMKSFNFSGISGSLLACLFRLFFLGDWTMFWVLQDPWRKQNFLHPRQSSWLHCLYFFLCVLLS